MDEVHLLMPTPLPRRIRDELDARFTVCRLFEAEDQEATLAAVAPQVRAIATGVPILVEDVSFPITGELMSRLPKLEMIANLGVGYDNIDIAAARARGVLVSNTPDVLTEETADTAFALMLNAVRQLPRAERWLREGRWLEKPFELTASLRGRTIGVLGMGRIGRAIARRAEAFGVRVIYHSRRQLPDTPYQYVDSVLNLARACDVLMVVVPGGPETRHIVNAEVLDALGPTGVLVNIARGSAVDEDALIAALRDRRILTAGLDVFADEPRVPAELLTMDHVVLLPHVGSATHVTREAMGRLLVENLLAWADGRQPPTLTPETPWRGARKRAH
ncbi:MAG TPA: 2-hydroxyacid dehydrogenase [Beijerinckiaceae bacterium]|jgi:lactate dehydrogenase-like 2-hydroxyacid dehydrogenase